MRFLQRLSDAKWWFLHRFHPKHRYHVVYSGLPPGWHDRDYLLAVLIRKVVMDFVELEKPFEQFDAKSEELRQLRELYEWFKTNSEHFNYEGNFLDDYDMITEKLIEAVRLRKLLW